MRKQIEKWLIRQPYIIKVMQTPLEPVCLREKSSPSVYTGFFLIFFSFVIGWPAVGAMGLLSFRLENPLFLTVGGPVLYGLSHITFNVGIWLAGRRYASTCLQWLVKTVVKRFVHIQDVRTSPKA